MNPEDLAKHIEAWRRIMHNTYQLASEAAADYSARPSAISRREFVLALARHFVATAHVEALTT